MYLTGHNESLGVIDCGIFGSLIKAGLGAAGSALNRGAANKKGQQDLDIEHKNRENQFQERQGGSFGERNAFKQRLLGNLADSFGTTRIGAGAPGSAGSFNLKMLDPQKLFAGITSGQFGQDLRGATTEGINSKVDFTAPKFESGTSFLGDLLGGAASAMPSFSGGIPGMGSIGNPAGGFAGASDFNMQLPGVG